MKVRSIAVVACMAGILGTTPICAQPVPPRGFPPPQYRGHGHGGHFWGPLSFVVGTALLYSALQPRTVYYQPRVIYSPPVYYYPPTTYIPPYPIAGDQVIVQTYPVAPTPAAPPPSVTSSSGMQNVQPGPGASGEYWSYVCKNPAGYYPDIMECPSGWMTLPRTASGKSKP